MPGFVCQGTCTFHARNCRGNKGAGTSSYSFGPALQGCLSLQCGAGASQAAANKVTAAAAASVNTVPTNTVVPASAPVVPSPGTVASTKNASQANNFFLTPVRLQHTPMDNCEQWRHIRDSLPAQAQRKQKALEAQRQAAVHQALAAEAASRKSEDILKEKYGASKVCFTCLNATQRTSIYLSRLSLGWFATCIVGWGGSVIF